jgi:hypothetical protein
MGFAGSYLRFFDDCGPQGLAALDTGRTSASLDFT